MIALQTQKSVDPTNLNDTFDLELDIDHLVNGLRKLRSNAFKTTSSNHLQKNLLLKLPSREALSKIVEGLSIALFPSRSGLPYLNDDGVDFFVGHTLDVTLRNLFEQIKRELQFSAELSLQESQDVEFNLIDQIDYTAKATDIIQDFSSQLLKVRRLLESDISAAYKGDPAARSVDEVLVSYPGINAITHYRLAHELHILGVPLIARIIAEIAHSATGIDIHPGATIGGSFFIDHGTGVVIGETAIVGERVRIYQAVTLGAKRFPTDENGELLKGGARHPIIEDDVVIYAGATILGRVTIGRNSSIGGNVWLTRSVPPHSNITQAQAHHELFGSGAGI